MVCQFHWIAFCVLGLLFSAESLIRLVALLITVSLIHRLTHVNTTTVHPSVQGSSTAL
jgi:hypothetical protein